MNQTMTLETITPAMAEGFLRVNKNVRVLSQREVDRLAGILLRGNWSHANGDAIRIDWDGNLIDGQHRLWAIIQSGVPMTTYVCRGVDPRATIDVGRKRTKNVLIATERPDLPAVYGVPSVLGGIGFLAACGDTRPVSTDQIYDYIDAYRDELDALLEVEPDRKIRTSATIAATFMAYVDGVSLETIGMVYDAISDGMVSDERLFPAVAYRNWLLNKNKRMRMNYHILKRLQYAINRCDINLSKKVFAKRKKDRSVEPEELIYQFPPFPREQNKE